MPEIQKSPTAERFGGISSIKLLNNESEYIKSLREAGFSMHEVKSSNGLVNAITYKKEDRELLKTGGKDNMLLLYAVQGEAGGTTHISTSFLSELQEDVDTVMGFNSALSFSALESGKYKHDLQNHADQMVEMYKESIPNDEKDNPIVLVGHSMGGTTAPIVAAKLLKQGYNVRDIIMIAPPGLVDRSSVKMLTDFIKLGNKEHIMPDIPTLYPSPADITGFADRHKVLAAKKDVTRLTREETEEIAYYELAMQRYTHPDELLLSNMTENERARVRQMDAEQEYLLQENPKAQDRIDHLQRTRTKILVGRAKEVIEGNIANQPTQKSPQMGRVVGNFVRSGAEMKRTIADLARETTVKVVQDVIDLNNTMPDHPLNLTIIAGDNDPVVGGYEVGDVNRIHVGLHTVYSEIGLNNFDHFTLPDDPVRVAHMVKRIIEHDKLKTDRLIIR